MMRRKLTAVAATLAAGLAMGLPQAGADTGTISAAEAAHAPAQAGDDGTAGRATPGLSTCGGVGGTYTHCEVVQCGPTLVYANYNPSTDDFSGEIPGARYSLGDSVQVRDQPHTYTGARGVVVYSGDTYGWVFVSRTCLPG